MAEFGLVATNGVLTALATHRRAWGDDHYARGVDQAIEEMAELTTALLHERRGRSAATRETVLGEIADVCLCLELIGQHHKITRAELLSVVTEKAVKLDVALESGTADPRIKAAHIEERDRAAKGR
jgi:hypothetical protein